MTKQRTGVRSCKKACSVKQCPVRSIFNYTFLSFYVKSQKKVPNPFIFTLEIKGITFIRVLGVC